jgi:hypothetical protein
MLAARCFLGLLGIYSAAGILFALLFVAVGIQRVDPATEHAPLTFRLIVVPGVVALWPLLLKRWLL